VSVGGGAAVLLIAWTAAILIKAHDHTPAKPPPASTGGLVVQTPDLSFVTAADLRVVTKKQPTPEQIEVPKFEPPPLARITDVDPVVLQKIDSKPSLPRPVVQQKVADRTTARPTNDAKPSDAAAAPRSGAPSASSSDAEQSWEQQILAQLEREKRYPSEARRQGMEDYVTVRFVIDRQGKVISARIVHSNGFGPLDEEALAVFHRVNLRPLPDEVKGQTIDRQVRLHFFAPHNS